jgi:D-3-phosphoglycerate dehydrogenase / 2-oxoglutarate reductase
VIRAVSTTRIAPDARVFLESELGWDVEEVAGVPADRSVRVLIVESDRVGLDELAALPGLALIVSVRGEPANVDLDAATARGVPVLHAPGRNAQAVAEFTIGLVIALLRHVVRTDALIRRGTLTESREDRLRDRRDVTWRPDDPRAIIPYRAFKGRGLRSTTLGVLGLGAVGSRVAELAGALGMHVIGHDPNVPEGPAGVERVTPPALLASSDVLTLHARVGNGPLIGAAELASMRPGAMLVNTARATALDYPALVAALHGGHLSGAALDVFPDEPLTPDDPLLELDNVILTPHIAGACVDVFEEQWRIVVEGLRSLLGPGPAALVPVRNPAALHGWDGLDGR